MTETTREWIAKADADYRTACRELRAEEWPNYDATCFHAQQCIEKLMKGVLIHCGVAPPKTHDLGWLDQLMRPVCPSWSCSAEDLRFLTRAAVGFRYPGEGAVREDAAEAVTICTRLREQLRTLLPLA